jgi:glycine cleavage system regulatory protein
MKNICNTFEELKTKISELSQENVYIIEVDAPIENIPKIASVLNEKVAEKNIAVIFAPKGLVTIHELRKGDPNA